MKLENVNKIKVERRIVPFRKYTLQLLARASCIYTTSYSQFRICHLNYVTFMFVNKHYAFVLFERFLRNICRYEFS